MHYHANPYPVTCVFASEYYGTDYEFQQMLRILLTHYNQHFSL